MYLYIQSYIIHLLVYLVVFFISFFVFFQFTVKGVNAYPKGQIATTRLTLVLLIQRGFVT